MKLALKIILLVIVVGAIIWAVRSVKTGQISETSPTPSPTPIVHVLSPRVISPVPNELIASPLKVTGEVPGSWYFEASFPVKLLDGNGKELAAVPAQAKSDWMTMGMVPFEATLNFEFPTTPTGMLVLSKDNPSGLPENEASVSIPIRFTVSNTPSLSNKGSLTGTMTIGPICPVEQAASPCRPTAEMFATRKVYVYKSDKKTSVATLTPDADGKFSATLLVGDYFVDMQHSAVGSISGVPAMVHIKAGTPVNLNISVDTGIR